MDTGFSFKAVLSVRDSRKQNAPSLTALNYWLERNGLSCSIPADGTGIIVIEIDLAKDTEVVSSNIQ